MHMQPMPATSGVTLTRKGRRYCESAKASQSPTSGLDAPSPSSGTGAVGITRPAQAPRARRKPLSITRARRAHIEAIVDQLLELLDADAGDPDLEPDADLEPSLSGPGYYSRGSYEVDLELDEKDAEPSLGWTDFEARYGRYADMALADGEAEHDGREPDADGEPWLASPACVGAISGIDATIGMGPDGVRILDTSNSWSQAPWARGGGADLEADPAEDGIADTGGAMWALGLTA